MYIMYTYILNKNFHQYSYGFQNIMSSWGLWSKISKLQQVGDVKDFLSKSSLFNFIKDFTNDFAVRLF